MSEHRRRPLRMAWGAYLLLVALGCEHSGGGGDRGASAAPAGSVAGSGTGGPAAEPGVRPDGAAGSVVDADAQGHMDARVAETADGAAPVASGGDGGAPVVRDAGVDAAAPPAVPRRDARPLASPPSYQGSVDDSAECTRSYPTFGFEPVGEPGERFPLFLYFVGTAFVMPDASASPDGDAALAVSAAMARRGFVALSAGYDNSALAWLSDHEAQLDCLFAADSPDSLLSRACALPQVDCELGIATWGHSQGALVGVMAARYDPRVRAAWTTGYGGDARSTLATSRLRVVNGEADTTNGTPDVLDTITGLTPADCPAGASTCLRADGSGWIIVRKAELADPAASSADHCWFDKRACLDTTIALEPTWVDPDSTRAYALELNADWVARTALQL